MLFVCVHGCVCVEMWLDLNHLLNQTLNRVRATEKKTQEMEVEIKVKGVNAIMVKKMFWNLSVVSKRRSFLLLLLFLLFSLYLYFIIVVLLA